MLNPFDPWSWLNTLFQWFIDSWTRSGGQALQEAIKQLTSAQFPDLSADWFIELWDSTFGLSIIVGLAAVMVHAIVFVFRANYQSLGQSLVGFARLVLNGGFLLLIVVTIMGLVDFLVKLMSGWTGSMVDSTTWTRPFAMTIDISGIDIWLKLAISNVGMYIGNGLYLSTLMMNYWIYIFVVWYLLGSALGVGKVAQFIRSVIFAALLTILLARVFQVFHLGLSAVILNVAQSLGVSSIVILLGVVASGAIAILIPVFMVIAFTIASFKVERRLDVRGFIEKQTRNTVPANSGQLAEERVGRIKAIGNGAKEATGGALRWAALAVATAAFAKVGAGIAAKAAMATPTPQTKALALGLIAVRAGANWLEGKTKSYIDARVGRPGASRARSRQQSS